ncbi:hypothetical protein ACIA8C_28805 [Nocardia sp. NPDC051321]|uniref:hypothetical protein n=1 Tax=Nocardia sp. NPDC051321 TaxID=3364323 RepID=UPI003792228A
MTVGYRSTGAAVLAGALLGAALLVAPSSAAPQAKRDARITCAEKGEVTWLNVGIGTLAVPVPWQVATTFHDCAGPDISDANPVPVSMAIAGTENVACDGPVTSHKGTGTIVWSDETTSEISETATSQTKAKGSGPGVFPISITSGHFEGHDAEEDSTVTLEGTCPGASAGTLTGTLRIF